MLKRSHYCGEIKENEIGKEIIVTGWVHAWRDHGGVIFIDLRDVSGIVQIVFNPEVSKEAHEVANKLRSEDVIAVKGIVEKRSEETINPKIPTGTIEIKISEIEILNKSLTPPFEVSDERVTVSEDRRLEYRYIDMRRQELQRNIKARHKLTQEVRSFLNKNRFFEIETPILNKSTPEGARDFLIPSRVNPGKFYALPQSPQIYKQILMAGGFERYYQIAKCFRDEDLRKDRQPEFTQIDMELSFIDEDDIYVLIEDMFKTVLKNVFDIDLSIPFKKYTYKEVMDKYGVDRPDLRIPLELTDITDLAEKTNFKVFTNTVSNNGIVKCLNVKGGAKLSRKDIDDLTSYVSIFGAKGLAWIKISEKGPESVVVKFIPEDVMQDILKRTNAETGDILFFGADTPKIVNDSLGNLRVKVAEKLGMIDENRMEFLWVTNFPLFEYDETEKRLTAMHHPFTHPKLSMDEVGSIDELIEALKNKPDSLLARSYDLVLNGIELGGGSIRIHNPQLQEQMFSSLGFDKDTMYEQFGFLLNALKYGTPPHGGIAFGLDRILMLMLKENSIRDVIPFPKTQKAIDLMSNSPSVVDDKQLRELFIKVVIDK